MNPFHFDLDLRISKMNPFHFDLDLRISKMDPFHNILVIFATLIRFRIRRFMKRIRIRRNEADQSGSGLSTTLNAM